MLTKKTTLLFLRILEKIVSDKTWHSRWLNTLSYLEYIGTRKMLKSLPAEILDNSLLGHINEEARHSLFFKSLAQKIGKADLGFKETELIASQAGRDYFQQVDHFSLKFSNSKPFLNYLYTTYAVEQRALTIYPLYDEILKQQGFSFSLRSVLNEEKEHLNFVLNEIQIADPDWEKHLDELRDFEHQKYFAFLIALEKELFEKPSLDPLLLVNKDKKMSFSQRT